MRASWKRASWKRASWLLVALAFFTAAPVAHADIVRVDARTFTEADPAAQCNSQTTIGGYLFPRVCYPAAANYYIDNRLWDTPLAPVLSVSVDTTVSGTVLPPVDVQVSTPARSSWGFVARPARSSWGKRQHKP